MPPPVIDPNALMNALTPALQSNGGLAGPNHALRVISILRDTKKLISKAVYLKVFQQHAPEAMEAFTHNGGWELLHQWLVEVSDKRLYNFMNEMVHVYKLLPVSVQLLKSNSTAKIIRQLRKDMDAPEDVRQAAGNLTDYWIGIVRQSHAASTDNAAPNLENGDVEFVKKVKKSKSDGHKSSEKSSSKKRQLSSDSDSQPPSHAPAKSLKKSSREPAPAPSKSSQNKYRTNSNISYSRANKHYSDYADDEDYDPSADLSPKSAKASRVGDSYNHSGSEKAVASKRSTPAASTVKTPREQLRKTGNHWWQPAGILLPLLLLLPLLSCRSNPLWWSQLQ